MLTSTQKKILDAVSEYIRIHQISPTITEIAAAIGFASKGTTSKYVNSLVELGFLGKYQEKPNSRNLFVTTKTIQSSNYVNHTIPLLGVIAAGQPIEAIAEKDAYTINDVIKGEQLFMLKVKGDSMIEVGINDGDHVICEKRDSARDGEIVVALIHGHETTLKRFYLQKTGKILLVPANSELSTQEYDANDVLIQGVLRGLYRNYS